MKIAHCRWLHKNQYTYTVTHKIVCTPEKLDFPFKIYFLRCPKSFFLKWMFERYHNTSFKSEYLTFYRTYAIKYNGSIQTISEKNVCEKYSRFWHFLCYIKLFVAYQKNWHILQNINWKQIHIKKNQITDFYIPNETTFEKFQTCVLLRRNQSIQKKWFRTTE